MLFLVHKEHLLKIPWKRLENGLHQQLHLRFWFQMTSAVSRQLSIIMPLQSLGIDINLSFDHAGFPFLLNSLVRSTLLARMSHYAPVHIPFCFKTPCSCFPVVAFAPRWSALIQCLIDSCLMPTFYTRDSIVNHLITIYHSDPISSTDGSKIKIWIPLSCQIQDSFHKNNDVRKALKSLSYLKSNIVKERNNK